MRILLILAALLTPQVAHASTITCSGDVDRLYLRASDGDVMVNYGHGMHLICNLNGTRYGITSESCKAFYSTLLTARSTGQPVDIYYRPEAVSCAALGDWTETGNHLFGINIG